MRTDTNIRRQRGISLVEILVVLMLTAMLAGIVVISAPPGRSDVQKNAERLAAKLEHAAQQAITSSVLIGAKIDEGGYTFFQYHRGEWKPAPSAQLTGGDFPSELSVTLIREEAAKKNERQNRLRQNQTETVIRPDLRFLPTGETTMATVAFQNRRELWRVTLDDSGHVEVSDESGE